MNEKVVRLVVILALISFILSSCGAASSGGCGMTRKNPLLSSDNNMDIQQYNNDKEQV